MPGVSKQLIKKHFDIINMIPIKALSVKYRIDSFLKKVFQTKVFGIFSINIFEIWKYLL